MKRDQETTIKIICLIANIVATFAIITYIHAYIYIPMNIMYIFTGVHSIQI